jgi:hypothetical protein
VRFSSLVAALLLALIILPGSALADITVGFISFDNLIPGAPGSPGVNAFNIANFSGDPAAGGDALPPTFPILTPVTFLNSSLALTSDGATVNLALGDIGPGFFSSGLLEFPDTQIFTSAIFSATLDVTTFQLAGGGAFTADSDLLVTSLLPSAGGALTAGTDFALIEVSPAASTVPEPSSLIPLVTLMFLFWPYRSKALA